MKEGEFMSLHSHLFVKTLTIQNLLLLQLLIKSC